MPEKARILPREPPPFGMGDGLVEKIDEIQSKKNNLLMNPNTARV